MCSVIYTYIHTTCRQFYLTQIYRFTVCHKLRFELEYMYIISQFKCCHVIAVENIFLTTNNKNKKTCYKICITHSLDNCLKSKPQLILTQSFWTDLNVFHIGVLIGKISLIGRIFQTESLRKAKTDLTCSFNLRSAWSLKSFAFWRAYGHTI